MLRAKLTRETTAASYCNTLQHTATIGTHCNTTQQQEKARKINVGNRFLSSMSFEAKGECEAWTI